MQDFESSYPKGGTIKKKKSKKDIFRRESTPLFKNVVNKFFMLGLHSAFLQAAISPAATLGLETAIPKGSKTKKMVRTKIGEVESVMNCHYLSI